MKKGRLLITCATFLLMMGCYDYASIERTPVYMKWIINGTVSEFFYGRERGYFLDRGVDIQIRAGGPGINGAQLVAANPGTFAVTGAEELVRAVSKKIPVQAIAVKFQQNPVCFLSRKASHVTKPADFKGKTIAVVYGENTEVQYRALLQSAGLSKEDVNEKLWSFDPRLFIEGTLDVIPAYCFDQPIALRREGFEDFEVIKPSAYGINPYGDVLITGTKTIEENSELVRKFVEAYLLSLSEATKNPDVAVQSLINTQKELDFTKEQETWSNAKEFVCAKGGSIGQMSEDGWEQVINLLDKYGQLRPASIPDVHSVFIGRFWSLAVHAQDGNMSEIVKCNGRQ